MSPADLAQTATEANLRLNEEAWQAEEEYYNSPEFAAQQRAERQAEEAWLRAAEYDPRAWEGEQDRFDRSVYGL